jgi:hypothetical protein
MMDDHLKDPGSAQYEIGVPTKGKVFRGLLNGGDIYGWVVDAKINAKNAFGGYTGKKLYRFVFRDSEIAYWLIPSASY